MSWIAEGTGEQGQNRLTEVALNLIALLIFHLFEHCRPSHIIIRIMKSRRRRHMRRVNAKGRLGRMESKALPGNDVYFLLLYQLTGLVFQRYGKQSDRAWCYGAEHPVL